MKCYCGRFEALPQIGGQISDGIIHVAELPWDGIVPCQVAELTREVQRLRDALEAITHAEVGGAPCISGAVAADALGIPWPPPPAATHSDRCIGRVHDSLGCSCGAAPPSAAPGCEWCGGTGWNLLHEDGDGWTCPACGGTGDK